MNAKHGKKNHAEGDCCNAKQKQKNTTDSKTKTKAS
jgi:hypothetical protein